MKGLELHNCSKSFGGKKIIDDVSFSVGEGEFCVLLGPSGCGKTTLLRMIAGLESMDGGRILIDGRDAGGLGPRDRDVAMVFQNYSLYPHLSVRGNLAFPLKMRGMKRAVIESKVRESAGLLGIGDLLDRKPAQLSGGQRQRVAMGRAIVRNPALFLFDEPLSNLDARLRASMRVELARLHRELGVAAVYVTHDQTEAMTLGQKLVLIDGGRIRQIGTPRDVYERPANLFAASFIGSPPINLINGRIGQAGPLPVFSAAGFTAPLPAGSAGKLAGLAGKEVTLGIRPESLTPGEGPLSGVIEHREHLGEGIVLYAGTASGMIAAKVPPDFRGGRGERISFGFRPEAMLIFFEGNRC